MGGSYLEHKAQNDSFQILLEMKPVDAIIVIIQWLTKFGVTDKLYIILFLSDHASVEENTSYSVKISKHIKNKLLEKHNCIRY